MGGDPSAALSVLRRISAPASNNVQSAALDLSDHDRPARGILTPEYFEQALSIKGPGELLLADSLA
jgi:hypothetical protein